MTAEPPQSQELDPALVAVYAVVFLSCGDYYPRQKDTGGYFVVERPLHVGVVMAHLRGNITIGSYALYPADEVKWLCFDADDTEHWKHLKGMAGALTDEGLAPYLELSRRGGHLWPFVPPTHGRDIRRIGKQILMEHDISGVELYPKQDCLSTGPGSLVRLPLGIHRVTGKRYSFITLNGQPLAPTIRDQMRLLATPQQVSQGFLADVLARAPHDQPASLPRFT